MTTDVSGLYRRRISYRRGFDRFATGRNLGGCGPTGFGANVFYPARYHGRIGSGKVALVEIVDIVRRLDQIGAY